MSTSKVTPTTLSVAAKAKDKTMEKKVLKLSKKWSFGPSTASNFVELRTKSLCIYAVLTNSLILQLLEISCKHVQNIPLLHSSALSGQKLALQVFCSFFSSWSPFLRYFPENLFPFYHIKQQRRPRFVGGKKQLYKVKNIMGHFPCLSGPRRSISNCPLLLMLSPFISHITGPLLSRYKSLRRPAKSPLKRVEEEEPAKKSFMPRFCKWRIASLEVALKRNCT